MPIARASLSLLLLLLLSPASGLGAERFGDGKKSVGLSVGYLETAFRLGERSAKELGLDIEAVTVAPHWSIGISDTLGGGVLRGNFDVVVEPMLLFRHPADGIGKGIQVLPRYNFLAGGDTVVPFVEIGAGFTFLDFDLRGQRDGLNFVVLGGLGSHVFVSERAALTPRVRYMHISNAGTRRPNQGLDTVQFLLGATYFLD